MPVLKAPIKHLLVWFEQPENVVFYLLDPKSEQASWAIESNDCMINGNELDEDHSIYKLNDWLATAEGKAAKTKPPVKGRITQVTMCGFIM